MKKSYAVVYEWAGSNYSAYVPDLPGSVSTGKTLADVKREIREAIEGHVRTLREFGEPVPEPTTRVGSVEAAA